MTTRSVTSQDVTSQDVTSQRVTIRRVSGTDLPELGRFFAGLSLRTRYQRFFAPVTPAGAMLRRLAGLDGTAGIDALVALCATTIIGHAMAVDQLGPNGAVPAGARPADVGVVVADAWQGRGVGSALMAALAARASSRGVSALSMDVLPGNTRVLDMIARRWPTARPRRGADCLTVGVHLPAGRAGTPAPAAPQPLPARPRRARSTCHTCGATAMASSSAVAASA